MARSRAFGILGAAGVFFVAIGAGSGGCGGGSGGNGFGTGDGSAGDGAMPNGDDAPVNFGDSTSDNFVGCATGMYAAAELPAALLVDLDVSGTMASDNKYAFAQSAIISAVDQDSFDSLTLGLMAFPQGTTAPPACLMGLVPSVACGTTGLPQVALQVAGMNKSTNPTGVRHDMYTWLTTNAPTQSSGDGNPTFDALNNGILALQGLGLQGKLILLYITDGGASCASVSARPGYDDANGCPDWEEPASIVSLLNSAHNDAMTPVNTFVVGVPGADTDNQDPTMDPPYSVRLALSAYAYAGSPETTPMGCNGTMFTQGGGDPSVPCHFDMTQNNYSAMALANAINQIRGQELGCSFALPGADGGSIDPTKVNVVLTINGMTVDLDKRSSSSDTCSTGDGCWDYGPNDEIELIGAACMDASTATSASVQIVVGCATIIK